MSQASHATLISQICSDSTSSTSPIENLQRYLKNYGTLHINQSYTEHELIGSSFLMYFCLLGHIPVVQWLMQQDIDIDEHIHGKTVLFHLCESVHRPHNAETVELISLLLNASASIFFKHYNFDLHALALVLSTPHEYNAFTVQIIKLLLTHLSTIESPINLAGHSDRLKQLQCTENNTTTSPAVIDDPEHGYVSIFAYMFHNPHQKFTSYFREIYQAFTTPIQEYSKNKTDVVYRENYSFRYWIVDQVLTSPILTMDLFQWVLEFPYCNPPPDPMLEEVSHYNLLYTLFEHGKTTIKNESIALVVKHILQLPTHMGDAYELYKYDFARLCIVLILCSITRDNTEYVEYIIRILYAAIVDYKPPQLPAGLLSLSRSGGMTTTPAPAQPIPLSLSNHTTVASPTASTAPPAQRQAPAEPPQEGEHRQNQYDPDKVYANGPFLTCYVRCEYVTLSLLKFFAQISGFEYEIAPYDPPARPSPSNASSSTSPRNNPASPTRTKKSGGAGSSKSSSSQASSNTNSKKSDEIESIIFNTPLKRSAALYLAYAQHFDKSDPKCVQVLEYFYDIRLYLYNSPDVWAKAIAIDISFLISNTVLPMDDFKQLFDKVYEIGTKRNAVLGTNEIFEYVFLISSRQKTPFANYGRLAYIVRTIIDKQANTPHATSNTSLITIRHSLTESFNRYFGYVYGYNHKGIDHIISLYTDIAPDLVLCAIKNVGELLAADIVTRTKGHTDLSSSMSEILYKHDTTGATPNIKPKSGKHDISGTPHMSPRIAPRGPAAGAGGQRIFTRQKEVDNHDPEESVALYSSDYSSGNDGFLLSQGMPMEEMSYQYELYCKRQLFVYGSPLYTYLYGTTGVENPFSCKTGYLVLQQLLTALSEFITKQSISTMSDRIFYCLYEILESLFRPSTISVRKKITAPYRSVAAPPINDRANRIDPFGPPVTSQNETTATAPPLTPSKPQLTLSELSKGMSPRLRPNATPEGSPRISAKASSSRQKGYSSRAMDGDRSRKPGGGRRKHRADPYEHIPAPKAYAPAENVHSIASATIKVPQHNTKKTTRVVDTSTPPPPSAALEHVELTTRMEDQNHTIEYQIKSIQLLMDFILSFPLASNQIIYLDINNLIMNGECSQHTFQVLHCFLERGLDAYPSIQLTTKHPSMQYACPAFFCFLANQHTITLTPEYVATFQLLVQYWIDCTIYDEINRDLPSTMKSNPRQYRAAMLTKLDGFNLDHLQTDFLIKMNEYTGGESLLHDLVVSSQVNMYMCDILQYFISTCCDRAILQSRVSIRRDIIDTLYPGKNEVLKPNQLQQASSMVQSSIRRPSSGELTQHSSFTHGSRDLPPLDGRSSGKLPRTPGQQHRMLMNAKDASRPPPNSWDMPGTSLDGLGIMLMKNIPTIPFDQYRLRNDPCHRPMQLIPTTMTTNSSTHGFPHYPLISSRYIGIEPTSFSAILMNQYHHYYITIFHAVLSQQTYTSITNDVVQLLWILLQYGYDVNNEMHIGRRIPFTPLQRMLTLFYPTPSLVHLVQIALNHNAHVNILDPFTKLNPLALFLRRFFHSHIDNPTIPMLPFVQSSMDIISLLLAAGSDITNLYTPVYIPDTPYKGSFLTALLCVIRTNPVNFIWYKILIQLLSRGLHRVDYLLYSPQYESSTNMVGASYLQTIFKEICSRASKSGDHTTNNSTRDLGNYMFPQPTTTRHVLKLPYYIRGDGEISLPDLPLTPVAHGGQRTTAPHNITGTVYTIANSISDDISTIPILNLDLAEESDRTPPPSPPPPPPLGDDASQRSLTPPPPPPPEDDDNHGDSSKQGGGIEQSDNVLRDHWKTLRSMNNHLPTIDYKQYQYSPSSIRNSIQLHAVWRTLLFYNGFHLLTPNTQYRSLAHALLFHPLQIVREVFFGADVVTRLISPSLSIYEKSTLIHHLTSISAADLLSNVMKRATSSSFPYPKNIIQRLDAIENISLIYDDLNHLSHLGFSPDQVQQPSTLGGIDGNMSKLDNTVMAPPHSTIPMDDIIAIPSKTLPAYSSTAAYFLSGSQKALYSARPPSSQDRMSAGLGESGDSAQLPGLSMPSTQPSLSTLSSSLNEPRISQQSLSMHSTDDVDIVPLPSLPLSYEQSRESSGHGSDESNIIFPPSTPACYKRSTQSRTLYRRDKTRGFMWYLVSTCLPSNDDILAFLMDAAEHGISLHYLHEENNASVLMYAILRRWSSDCLFMIINRIGIDDVLHHRDNYGHTALDYLYICQCQDGYASDVIEFLEACQQ